MRYEVELVDPHGEDPNEKMKERIEAGGKQGKVLHSIIPNFSRVLIIWQIPGKEQRG